jgi:hypothetical protein
MSKFAQHSDEVHDSPVGAAARPAGAACRARRADQGPMPPAQRDSDTAAAAQIRVRSWLWPSAGGPGSETVTASSCLVPPAAEVSTLAASLRVAGAPAA